MATTQSIGMMDPAYFVSKTQLLEWVNKLLKLDLQKIEECCTGAVYCQIIDSLYPCTVKMKKVNWKAKKEYEYIENYKILQQAFQTNNIMQHVQVEKLIKGKYQDNLEFLQWIKRFFEANYNHCNSQSYDPVARRQFQKGLTQNQNQNLAPLPQPNLNLLQSTNQQQFQDNQQQYAQFNQNFNLQNQQPVVMQSSFIQPLNSSNPSNNYPQKSALKSSSLFPFTQEKNDSSSFSVREPLSPIHQNQLELAQDVTYSNIQVNKYKRENESSLSAKKTVQFSPQLVQFDDNQQISRNDTDVNLDDKQMIEQLKREKDELLAQCNKQKQESDHFYNTLQVLDQYLNLADEEVKQSPLFADIAKILYCDQNDLESLIQILKI